MKNNFQKLALITAVATLTQCTTNTEQEKTQEKADSSADKQTAAEPYTADESSVFKFDMVLANLPSPMEILNDLNKSKQQFSQQILTGEKKFQSATVSQQKALFMGAYSIDMGYVINYEQNQLILNYMASIKKLSDDLNISQYYDQSFMERFNKNIEHKDSLIKMTNDVFSLTDKYLRNNEQLKTSLLILTGSWIESIYFCAELVKDSPKSEVNAPIYARLWNQRLHLKQLLGAMEPFKDDNYIKKMIPVFNDILAVCNQTSSTEEFSMEHAKAIAGKIQKLHEELL